MLNYKKSPGLKRNSMIILMYNEGQMCNQLLAIASILTIGLEYKRDVICPIVDKSLYQYFNMKLKESSIKVIFGYSRVVLIISKIVIKFNRKFHVKIKKFDPGRNGIQIFFDWRVKEPDVFIKHLAKIQEFFDIKQDIKDRCFDIIKAYRFDNKRIIGVHIRRGDYKEFNEGRWYFSDHRYMRWIKSISEQGKFRFLLFSNETINIESYKNFGLDVEYIKGNAVEDLCCLSMCDMIMGPPSTYSWWAAMYGNIPRLVLEDKSKDYSIKEFLYLSDRVARKCDDY